MQPASLVSVSPASKSTHDAPAPGKVECCCPECFAVRQMRAAPGRSDGCEASVGRSRVSRTLLFTLNAIGGVL